MNRKNEKSIGIGILSLLTYVNTGYPVPKTRVTVKDDDDGILHFDIPLNVFNTSRIVDMLIGGPKLVIAGASGMAIEDELYDFCWCKSPTSGKIFTAIVSVADVYDTAPEYLARLVSQQALLKITDKPQEGE